MAGEERRISARAERTLAELRDDGIGCSCHGSAFDLETGEPISPPATEPIKTFPCQERDGEIFVGVSPGEAPAGPTRRARRSL